MAISARINPLFPAYDDAEGQFALKQAQAIPLPLAVILLSTATFREANEKYPSALFAGGVFGSKEYHDLKAYLLAILPPEGWPQ